MWESDYNLGFPHKASFKIYYISGEIRMFLASIKDAVTGLNVGLGSAENTILILHDG